MTTDIQLRPTGNALTLQDKMEYAKALAVASLLPRSYQQNPGNLLFAMEYAEALNIAPIHAITSIHVIDGKPAASADLIAAVLRRAGHKLLVTGDSTKATAQLVRADIPDFVYEASWDMDKARTAGLTNKSVWKNYPAAMLRSRAITEVARMGGTDALYGVVYTPEELGAEVDQQGVPVLTSVPAAAPVTAAEIIGQRPAAPATQQPPATPGSAVDSAAEPAQSPSARMVTRPQGTKIQALYKDIGVESRDNRIADMAGYLGRDITSTNDLTLDEAKLLIDRLEKTLSEKAGGAP